MDIPEQLLDPHEGTSITMQFLGLFDSAIGAARR
jgi:hypothetical protein